MAKTKSNKNTIRTGLIFVMAWLMVASLIITTAAATSGSGETSNNHFSWSWVTDNTNTSAAGTFSADATTGTEGQKLLTLNISANSSTYIPEQKNDCGSVTQHRVDAKSTINKATLTNTTGSPIRITVVEASAAYGIPDNNIVNNGATFTVSIQADPQGAEDQTSRQASGKVVFEYEIVENLDLIYYGADGASYSYGDTLLDDAADQVSTQVAPGTVITLPEAPTVTGGTFEGWRVGHVGSLFQPGTTVEITADSSVYPVITTEGMLEPFTIGSKTYKFWTDAAADAAAVATASNPVVIVLNQDYTLKTTLLENGVSPSGSVYVKPLNGSVSYVVPKNVIFQIPYNLDNTLCTTKPTALAPEKVADPAGGANYVANTVYRTLTMPAGVNITIDGGMSLSASAFVSQFWNGCPGGPLSFVRMESGSSITVNDGGALYAWGYITGSGAVTAKSGAKIYESFQVRDWRGGSDTIPMVNSAKRVFPISQYYIQNIEVPLTLEAGSYEYAYMYVSYSVLVSTATSGGEVPFVGPSSLFRISEGSMTKDYDENTDRMIYTINGKAALESFAVSIDAALGQKMNLNSSDFILPLNSNMTITCAVGSTINVNNRMGVLPGVQINIEETGKVVLGANGGAYLYDRDEWFREDGKGYVNHTNVRIMPLVYVPGRAATAVRNDSSLVDAAIRVDGTLEADLSGIYTTAGGANIYSTGTGQVIATAGTVTYTEQFLQNIGSDGRSDEYVQIPVNPAWLKNADGSFVKSGTNTYTYTNDKWICKTHTEVVDAAVAATCTTTGLTEGKHCSVCNTVIVAQTEVAAKGHTEVIDAAVAPTCTATGLTEGKHCSVCNTVLVAQTEIPVLGHTEVIDAAVAATCTTTGLTEGKHCSVCNTVLVAQTEIPVLGHTEVIDPAVDPTCTETGLTVGSHCSVCGEILVAQTKVEANGHAWVDGDVITEATCTEEGTRQQNCTACGGTQTVAIPSLGHKPGNDATCTEAQTCTVCGEELAGSLGHTEAVDAAKAPTCTETGLTEGKHCSVCNEVLVKQQVVAALGHKPGAAATCTEAQTCTVCGAEVGEALDHAYDDGVVTLPTCVTEGFTTYTCTREGCGHSYTDNVIVATGHTAGAEATCTTAQSCTLCGEEMLPALGHIWSAGVCGRNCGREFTFKMVNMALKDGLDLYFYIDPSDVVGIEDQIYCKFVKEYVDRDPVTADISEFEKYTDNGVTYYRYRFSGIAAKEMKDKITGQICFSATGAAASKSYTETIFDHVHDLYERNSSNEPLVKILADLLNYGASCQTLFSYDVENLVNQAADENLMLKATKTDVTFTSGLTKGDYLYGTSFSARNKLMFTFYFDFGRTTAEGSTASIDLSQYTVRVTYKTTSGQDVSTNYGQEKWFLRKQGDKVLYGIDVEGITLAAGATSITCELVDATGTVVSTNIDSIPSYASRSTEGTALYNTMQALVKAINSADAFFNNK